MKIGFLGLLTLIFITLKLVGTITWSWIWVLAPLWVGTAFGLIMIFLLVMVKAAQSK